MTKVLNQQLYTEIAYGGENSGDNLRLESTSNPTKGLVEVVGTALDIIVGAVSARISHTNTLTRNYTLPDVSGQIFVSGLFTGANQLVYSSAPGVTAILANQVSSALTTDASGLPVWVTGVNAQVLTIVGGVPQFQTPPDTGSVDTSPSANNIAYYAVAGNDVTYLTTVTGRALLSPGGVPSWVLITAPYLSAFGGAALGNGTLGQVLTSVGDGTFSWSTPDPSVINPGTQYALPFYSSPGSGTTLDPSVFMVTDEITRSLGLLNQGRLRFYEATVNGGNYVEFRAPSSIGPNVTWTLPGVDGVAGATLQTDGFGNLSFLFVDNGSVAPALANQLAYYAVNGNDVQGLPTTSNRTLLSIGTVPTWALITAPYLSAIGGVPLGNGLLNQVLCSDANGNFTWQTATDLTGEVLSGQQNYLSYYPATGTKVDDTSFLRIDNTLKILDLQDNTRLRFYEDGSNGSNFVQFQSPVALAADLLLTLPSVDGLTGHALITDGAGILSFIEVGRGVVSPAATTEIRLAYYNGLSNTVAGHGIVDDFPNVAERLLRTSTGPDIEWGLLQTQYLATTGYVPLGVGVPGEVLTPDGLNNFVWTDPASLVGKINPGVGTHLAFYPASGIQVDDSSFLLNIEGSRSLELRLGGGTRFYDLDDSNYVELRVDPAVDLLANQIFYLPVTDGLAGYIMTTDGAGTLSLTEQVAPGVTNAVARYNSTARLVQPSANFFNDATGLQLTGLLFTVAGAAGATPTEIVIGSGSGTGVGVDGANLTLRAGDSALADPGELFLGYGTTDYLQLHRDSGLDFIRVLNSAILRFDDADASNYIGFVAPAVVASDTIWTLPSADGLSGHALITNGAGTLSFTEVGHGEVQPGVLNAIPYYAGTTVGGYGIINDGALLYPVGLPPSPGYTLLVDDVTGQLTYAQLVVPAGMPGQIAVYTGAQQVGYYPNFVYDDVNNEVELRDQGAIQFNELTVNGASAVRLTGPASLSSSYQLTLPEVQATEGQILSADDNAGTLIFVDPGSNTNFEKRGAIEIEPGTLETTVIFDSPFAASPGYVNVQWMITDALSPEVLPTMGIGQVTVEGFVIRFSSVVTTGYSFRWEARLNGETTANLYALLAGGDSGGPLSSVLYYGLDLDTIGPVLTGSLSSARAYPGSGSSALQGKIVGGEDGVSSFSVITSYTYATDTLADLVPTLSVDRSGMASVGNRTSAYFCGGEDVAASPYTSIDRLVHATDTATILGAVLTGTAVKRAAAHSYTAGYVVRDAVTGPINILNFALETVSASPSSLGVNNVAVGCNNAGDGAAYLGRDNGALYKYQFLTDTITTLPSTVSSVTGLSSAFNSLRKGYFAGEQFIDSLDFATETTQAVASLPTANNLSASSTAFQSRGLL